MRTPDGVIGSIYSLLFRGFYSTAFQPIVNTGSGLVISYESLLRGPEGTPLANPKQTLVHSMARMSERMGARLIAEGIETEGEFAAMRALSVPMSQGYCLGRPQPAGQWQEPVCAGAAARTQG